MIQGVCMCMHMCVCVMEYYSAIKKNEKFAICSNTAGPGRHYA